MNRSAQPGSVAINLALALIIVALLAAAAWYLMLRKRPGRVSQ
jgi:hypothetical protein